MQFYDLEKVSLYGWPSAKLLVYAVPEVTRPAEIATLPSLTAGGKIEVCVWLLAQFLLLTLASSKRTVYLMSLAPAAAVIAAEYAGVVLDWLRHKSQTSALAKRISDHHRGLAMTLLGIIVSCYLVAAYLAPRADRAVSFEPVSAQALSLQASGKHIANC